MENASEIAAKLGFPLVAKVASAEIVHKTEIGGVRLNLQNAQEVHAAVSDLQVHSGEILLEKMSAPPVAELIVGIKRDPQFGLALVMGAGGIFAELVNDAVSLLLPASRDDLVQALHSLRIYSVIKGFRGNVGGDEGAIIDAIDAVVRFAEAHRDSLLELDVNPLQVLQDGVLAVDAFVKRIE